MIPRVAIAILAGSLAAGAASAPIRRTVRRQEQGRDELHDDRRRYLGERRRKNLEFHGDGEKRGTA